MGSSLHGTTGIGHTRWATHGIPNDVNAHPHTDCNNQIAIVHNGIIENYAELKKELAAKGHIFRSETDTEVVVHLIEEQYAKTPDLLSAVRGALPYLVGCTPSWLLHPGRLPDRGTERQSAGAGDWR